MKISEDKRTLEIEIRRTLSAKEVESLIYELAECRAKMLPEVSNTLPVSDPTQKWLSQDQPSVQAKVLTDGRTRFWVRNQGLGWLAFNFNVDQSLKLRDFFASALDEDASFFVSERDDGDTSH